MPPAAAESHHINDVPLQGAHFADTQASVQADGDAEIKKGEGLFHAGRQLAQIGDGQQLNVPN